MNSKRKTTRNGEDLKQRKMQSGKHRDNEIWKDRKTENSRESEIRESKRVKQRG